MHHATCTLHALTPSHHKILTRCCCVCSLFKGDQAAQNRLKHFITEDTFTVNEKYVKSVQVKAYHNLCMATNTEKAIDLTDNSERRICIMECVTPNYTDAHWARLHTLTWDQDVADIYYSYLCDESLVDTSKFVKGRALTTNFKKQSIALQRPIAAILLQRICEEPDYMRAYAIKSGRYITADDSDLDKLVLKSRPNPCILTHMEPEAAARHELNEDYRHTDALKLGTDISKDFFFEIIKSVYGHQTLHGREKSDDAYNTAMRQLFKPLMKEITVKIRFCLDNSGRVTRGYRLPSVEGLRYLLEKANWWAMDD